jgi:anti-anti-sigma regulatory factor
MIDLEIVNDDPYVRITFKQDLEGIKLQDLKKTLEDIDSLNTRMLEVDLRIVKKLSTSGLGLIYTMYNRAKDICVPIVFICNDYLREQIRFLDRDAELLIADSEHRARILLKSLYFKNKNVQA